MGSGGERHIVAGGGGNVARDRRQRRGRIGAAGREEQARAAHDDAEAEIGGDALDREEKERRDEGKEQPQRVEAEVLAPALADAEEGIAEAAARVGLAGPLCLYSWLREWT